MTQYVEIDGFDNVCKFVDEESMPVRSGYRYEVQDPPVTQFPKAPYRNAVLKRIDGENVWEDNRTYEERCEDVRAERDRRYEPSDRMVMQCFRLQQSMSSAWAAYAQALADVPQQSGFPDSVVWPELPT